MRTRGFTLIEVLVALAIVAIGMAAVMGALNSSANTISYLRDKSFAQWVALNQLTTIRVSGAAPPTGNTSGDVDFAGRSWHWRMEVVTTDIPGMVRMEVSVRPADVKGDDNGPWFTTVSGLYGDAVGLPNPYQPQWGVQMLPGQAAPPSAPGMGSLGTSSSFGLSGGSSSTLGGAASGLGGSSGGLGGNPPSGSGIGGPSTLGGSAPDSGGYNPPNPPPQNNNDEDSPQ